MKTKILLTAILTIFSLTVFANRIQAQDTQQTPDNTGYILESLVHDGDIVDFLHILSLKCNRNIIPTKAVSGNVKVNLFDVSCKEALDAILPAYGYTYEEKGAFIFVYTQKEYTAMMATNRKMETRVFTLNYVPAESINSLITPVLSSSGSVSVSPKIQNTSPESWAAKNCIIVIDYPEHLEMINQIIDEIDVRPPQVLIEATILVASLNDTNEFGIDFNVLSGVDFVHNNGGFGIPDNSGSFTGTEVAAGTGMTSKISDGGLSLNIANSNVNILIKAIETITDVVTLGNPKVLTLNRQKGRVIVGNKDGYITTEVSQTTSTQTVDFLETGTQLSFIPFVMDDGYIRMELMTKDSDGGVETKGAYVLPSEQTAEVTSNVLVKDGNTIVIGGLFRDKTSVTRSQVPLLGDIPGVGTLFRSQSDNVSKEEVIFLITPHIIQEKADYAMAEEVQTNIDRARESVSKKLIPIGRTRLAEYYYRQARQAIELGELKDAKKYIDRSAYIMPLHKDAIALQQEMSSTELIESDKHSVRNFVYKILQQDTLLDKQ